mgnify:CR=1 FL=1
MQVFVPFRHTMDFYTKSDDHDHWSFDDMDEEEFTPEMRRIRSWEWIIVLDRAYVHGTIICCCNQTIHGDRLSVHALKPYRNIRNGLHLNTSICVTETLAQELHHDAVEMMQQLKEAYWHRITNSSNKFINPHGTVCNYVMNCITYNHE